MSTTITGRLTKDPEVKFVGNKGTAVCSLSLAVNRKKGEQESVHYFDVTVWGTLAENIASSLRKGQRVVATGQLKQERYTDKSGTERSKVVLDAQDLGPSLMWATASVTDNKGKTSDEEAF